MDRYFERPVGVDPKTGETAASFLESTFQSTRNAQKASEITVISDTPRFHRVSIEIFRNLS